MWIEVSFRGYHNHSGSPGKNYLPCFPKQHICLRLKHLWYLKQRERVHSHLSSAVCVWLLKTKPAVELEGGKRWCWSWIDCRQVKERLVGDPTLAKTHREECEVVYLWFLPLSAQDRSLQEDDLLGGQTSIAGRWEQKERDEGKRATAETGNSTRLWWNYFFHRTFFFFFDTNLFRNS